jgi:hypothetical protein
MMERAKCDRMRGKSIELLSLCQDRANARLAVHANAPAVRIVTQGSHIQGAELSRSAVTLKNPVATDVVAAPRLHNGAAALPDISATT